MNACFVTYEVMNLLYHNFIRLFFLNTHFLEVHYGIAALDNAQKLINWERDDFLFNRVKIVRGVLEDDRYHFISL
jgi:hypothetical protein